MRRMILVLGLATGCWIDRNTDPCKGPAGNCGSATRPPKGSGYCTSDALCGYGLVCDSSTGACALPTSGCGQQSFTPKKTKADVLLVLDRSASMASPTATGSKWMDVVSSLDAVLSDTAMDVNWGVELFPSEGGSGCAANNVAMEPAPGQGTAVLQRIANASPTGGGTPTADAVRTAGSQLHQLADGTQKYILLATDGEPNCASGGLGPDVAGAISAVAEQANNNIFTFVFGIATGDTDAHTLGQLAIAGGEARTGANAYYLTQDRHDLGLALQLVSRQVGYCTFDLVPPPPRGNTLELEVGGRSFPRDTTHLGDGWDVTGGGKAIALYGAACDSAVVAGSIMVRYVCGAGTHCDASSMQCVTDPSGSPDGGTGSGTGGSGGSSGSSGSTGGTGGSGGGSGGCGPMDMCHYNAQCGSGGICVNGMCSRGCSADTQCGTGDVCIGAHCTGSSTSGGQCAFNTDCAASGAVCINGYCHGSCTMNSQCGANDICDLGICQPNWHRVASCTASSQCANPMACVDGLCRTPCWQSTDCASSPSGSVCYTGYCFQPNQANPQCVLASDCPSPENCIDATCR